MTRHIAGETLIVPVTGDMTDLESIYVLNEVGSRVWELVGSPRTVGEIVTIVAGEFAVSSERAEVDVTEFLDSLSARGLIEHLTESG